MKCNYEIYVEGRVQGVGFRYFVLSKARELQLTGYARNCRDGSVMVVAEGELTDLSALIDYLWIGPARGRVDNVKVASSPFSGDFEGFTIK